MLFLKQRVIKTKLIHFVRLSITSSALGFILYYNSDPEAMSSLPPISHFHNKFTVCVHLLDRKCMLFSFDIVLFIN